MLGDNMDNEDRIIWNTDTEDDGIVRWETDINERDRVHVITGRDDEKETTFFFCSACGNRINKEFEICPYCGMRVKERLQHEKSGGYLSLLVGVLVGFVALILLEWIPIVGPILAGFIAGLITGGGAGRGAVAGFIVGSMWFLFIAAIIGGILPAMSDDLIGSLFAFIGMLGTVLLIILGLIYGILCMVGGAIGGFLRK